MANPRQFFENMVRPAYQDWQKQPLAEHRAKATVGYLNDIAERMFRHLGPVQDYGRTAIYRDALSADHPDFGLVRDIADGTKHFEVKRNNRKISSANQTGRGALEWEKLGDLWEDADYTWDESGDLLIVTLDSGEQRSLIAIANNVMAMWENLLKKNGL